MCDAPLELAFLPTTVHFCPPQGPFLLSKIHFSSYFCVDQQMQRRFRVRRASRAVILAHHGPSSTFAHQGPFLPTEVLSSVHFACFRRVLLLLPCFCRSVFVVDRVFLPCESRIFSARDPDIVIRVFLPVLLCRSLSIACTGDADGGAGAHTTHEQSLVFVLQGRTLTHEAVERTHAFASCFTNALLLLYCFLIIYNRHNEQLEKRLSSRYCSGRRSCS